VLVRAKTLSLELATTIKPGFDALVFNASCGIEDIYELTKFVRMAAAFRRSCRSPRYVMIREESSVTY
jgi:hypothetical protein